MKTINNSKPLTPGQKRVLDFINSFLVDKGYPPSLSETAKHFRKSIGTAQHFVRELRAKGYLSNEQNVSRGIKPTSNGTKEIFLFGLIAAGEPIEPIENPEPTVIPANMAEAPGNYYALRVKGDSMTGEGILDGDTIVIKHQNVSTNGDVVVAVTKQGATLKRFYSFGNEIELRAANEKLKDWPRKFRVCNVEIRGKYCGLIRKVNKT